MLDRFSPTGRAGQEGYRIQTMRELVSVSRHDVYLWGIMAIALVLRFYRLTSLSLWLDEGSTIRISKLPVPQLLGSAGVYDTHPPLYYLIVHYVLKLAPDVLAGRLVSAIAGALSVLLIYLLGKGLYSQQVGRVSAVLTAVSPLHIWYSQEARMYALLGFTTLLSYLSLWFMLNRERMWYSGVYILSTVLALYTDYSAALVIAPQLLLLIVPLRQRWARRKFVMSLIIILLLYMPWLDLTLETFSMVATRGVLPDIGPVTPRLLFLTMLDFTGLGSTYFFGAQLPWTRWPFLMVIILFIQFLGIGKGLQALRKYPDRALLLSGLVAIPPFSLFLLSMRTPAYWTRAVIGASFGLSLLLAIGIASLGQARKCTQVALASVIFASALGPAFVSSFVMYNAAAKQKWRDLARDLEVGFRSDSAVVYYPGIAKTLVNAYFVPSRQDGIEQAIGDGATYEQIDYLLGTSVTGVRSVWLVYQEYPGLDTVREWLFDQGYEIVFSKTYWYPLGLELYSQERDLIGENILANSDFESLDDGEPVRWDFNGSHAVDGGALIQINTVENPPNDAAQTVVLQPRTFYFLTFEYRNALSRGSQRVYVLLFDSDDEVLEIAPSGAGLELSATETWASGRLGFITPDGTVKGRVYLRNWGVGKTWFRHLSLVQEQ